MPELNKSTVSDRRADWETPVVRRLDAVEAEGATGTGSDHTVFS